MNNGKPKSERYIFLGMPSYNAQHTDAAGKSFWRACHDAVGGRREPENEKPDDVFQVIRTGSLLACVMNCLWAHALNIVHQGGRVDYFAMMHSDIGLQEYWLDSLIDELEEHHLDMLGVVAPLKDTRGVSSVALERPDGDNWRVHSRLTMAEVYRLPPTFTSADLGYNLLLNTGCWVCKFDEERCKQVDFTINDRIVFNTATNMYQAQNESEDWYFSRMAHRLGWKIGCTRKIQLAHRGDINFLNTHPWGSNPFDSEYVTETMVPNEAPAQYVFPNDVDGWLEPVEGQALYDLSVGKRVLEIGSYCGRSTICIAQGAEHVTTVDYHDGRGTPAPKRTLPLLLINLNRYGVKNKVNIIQPWDTVPTEYFDRVFIDGAHDYESVHTDIERCRDCLKPDGLMIFHDYRPTSAEDRGVYQAVSELLASGGELLSVHDSLAVVKPPAAIPLEVCNG